MGCDGGTIPKRHELVKGPKKLEKVDKNAELIARWYYCKLSQEKLKKPIVACELGRLYNKDAVIEYLLDKSADKPHAESAAHIKSIKNVIELNLSDNPVWGGEKRNTKGDIYDDQCAQFICPVVGLEMNGRHRFCVLRQCGCVFSERALKEIKTDLCHKVETIGTTEDNLAHIYFQIKIPPMNSKNTIYKPVKEYGQSSPTDEADAAKRVWCGAEFREDDVIILNGEKEEVEELRKKMEERRLNAKLQKKSKKTKAAESASQCDPGEDSAETSKQTNGSTSNPRDKIQFVSSTKIAAETSSASSEKSAKAPSAPSKRGAPSDGAKSEAYKSIFTSHSSAKRTRDQSSNWVTHTAYYF